MKPIIIANWKMNKTNKEAISFIIELKNRVRYIRNVDIVICPPFTILSDISKELKNSNIYVGGQNMFYEEKGAFTGEISPLMLKAVSCKYVILGHSERRYYFNETDDLINKKIKSALKHDLIPILCVGENLEQRKNNETKMTIKKQLNKCLEGLKQNDILEIVVAYEPVWAIGTGNNASPEQAEEIHLFIKGLLKKEYNIGKTRIIYGGSVNHMNIKELMSIPDIDGCLVGGASLNVSSFFKIINFR
jgi:triosephosphate isomerase